MLGRTIFRYFSRFTDWDTIGVMRDSSKFGNIVGTEKDKIIQINHIDEYQINKIIEAFAPSHIVNCIGVIKQKSSDLQNIEEVIKINSVLPHVIYRLSRNSESRLIHFSTDCVFSGCVGDYMEEDISDATDLYGKSKYLGELNAADSLTIRTSIIGHEYLSKNSLLEWFLAQRGDVRGFHNAFFNGLTTFEIAKILEDHILADRSLNGTLHVGGNSISKFHLLKLFKNFYKWSYDIEDEFETKINRSLSIDKFVSKTNYQITSWENLVAEMIEFEEKNARLEK